MKTPARNILMTVAILLVALSAQAQDYLTIHFHNGNTKRHLLSLIESIETSRIDNEGVYHFDYKMQKIVMSDTTYTYLLSDIDSITYHAVSQAQIKETLQRTLPTIVELYSEKTEVGDMAKHMDYIRELEGVEDAFISDDAFVVKFEGCRGIVFSYCGQPKADYAANGWTPVLRAATRARDTNRPENIYNSISVVVANQQHYDQRRLNNINYFLKPLIDEFNSLGFSARYIPDDNEVPDMNFFENTMYDNDIVVLSTHGNSWEGRHWIETGEQLDIFRVNKDGSKPWSDIADRFIDEEQSLFKEKYDIDEVWIGYQEEYRPTISGNDLAYVIYPIVSEQFFARTRRSFQSEYALFFNIACKSLYGTDVLKQNSTGKLDLGSSSMANTFHNKGADIYFGYNYSNFYGQRAAALLLQYMLQGCSEEMAMKLLYPLYLFEDMKQDGNLHNARLFDLVDSDSDTARQLFIVRTFTEEIGENEPIPISDGKVKVTGITSKLVNPVIDTSISLDAGVTAGFRYGTDPSMKKYQYIRNCNLVLSPNEKGNYIFSAEFDVEPGTTYYYQANTYDGLNYNLGEICSITASVRPEKQALIEVTTLEIDFEKVEVGTTAEKTFTVKNTGDADLSYTIQCLSDDRPYFVPDGKTSLTLAPGKSKTHKVCFAPDREGGAYYTFEITSNAANSGVQTISLKGSGINPQPIENGYVDLGLSVMWATCNIGADSPVEFGEYFAWGETVTKERFEWNNYKFCKGGSQRRITKYCDIANYGENGFTDGKTVLDPEDDVAHLRLGDGHRIPTANEWVELFNNCSIKYELNNGVKGIWLTSKINSNRIFLPFTREYGNGSNYGSEYVGNYWSANLESPAMAYYAGINQTQGNVSDHIRCIAKTIRPILSDADISSNTETLDFGEVEMYDSETEYLKICNNGSRPITVLLSVTDNSIFKTDTDARYTIAAGSSTEIPVNFTPDRELDYKSTISVFSTAHTLLKTITVIGKGTSSNIPAEVVDLGLSVKWASYNVGAQKPEEFGNHYAWGETDIKENYSWETYKYCEGSQYTLTKYNDYSSNGVVDNKVTLDPEDDAAYMKWHGNWRTPTKEEWDELIKNCSCTLTQLNGVTGFKLTSKVNGYTDKWIFLPCAGYYRYQEWPSRTIYENSQTSLEYWSATSLRTKAYAVYNNSGRLATGSSSIRCNGYPVRPVSD